MIVLLENNAKTHTGKSSYILEIYSVTIDYFQGPLYALVPGPDLQHTFSQIWVLFLNIHAFFRVPTGPGKPGKWKLAWKCSGILNFWKVIEVLYYTKCLLASQGVGAE